MLSHLVYVSNRKPNCTEEEIEKILAACQKNNAHLNITGVLMYSDTHFVQYLEGDYKEIVGLYDKIKGDDRHKNAVLITSAPISSRLFPNWQMGSKKITSSEIDFKTDITPEDKATFQDILAGKKQENNRAVTLMQKVFK
jgi:hypothetical protein